MSLLYGSNFIGHYDLSGKYFAFFYLFKDTTTLINAEHLIFPTVMEYESCDCMFKNCTSLITAPELPATTVAQSCYIGMFSGCTSLVKAPSILPATSLGVAGNCYTNMFTDCTSLEKAPIIQATTLSG